MTAVVRWRLARGRMCRLLRVLAAVTVPQPPRRGGDPAPSSGAAARRPWARATAGTGRPPAGELAPAGLAGLVFLLKDILSGVTLVIRVVRTLVHA